MGINTKKLKLPMKHVELTEDLKTFVISGNDQRSMARKEKCPLENCGSYSTYFNTVKKVFYEQKTHQT